MSTVRQSLNLIVSFTLVVLLVVGVVSISLSAISYSTIKGSLDSISGDGSADPYTESVHDRLHWAFIVIGLVFVGLAASLQTIRPKWERQLVDFIGTAIADGNRLFLQWGTRLGERKISLTVLVLVGMALRLLYLQQPMRYDEAHSFLEYSSQPWFVTVAKYTDPNNHVGHNILVNVLTQLLGDSEIVIRLPAYLAGVLMIPFTYLLTRQFSPSSSSALLSAAVVATSSPLIEYSTNARGYTLIALMTLIAWLCAHETRESRNRAAQLGLILSGAFGLWVIPVMLYPLSMIYAWGVFSPLTSLSHPVPLFQRFQWFLLYGIATVVVTVLLYLPIILVEGSTSLIANPYVESLSIEKFEQRLSVSALATMSFLGRDIGLTLGVMLSLASFWGIVTSCLPSRTSLLTGFASIAIPVSLLAVQRVVPPERVWLYLIPLGAIFSGIGLQQLWGNVPSPQIHRLGWGIASLTLCVWPAMHMLVNDPVSSSPQTGAVPEAREIVKFLEGQLAAQTPVIAVTPCSAPIKYYARHSELGMHHFEHPGKHNSLNSNSGILILSKSSAQTIGSTLESLSLDEMYSPAQFQPWKQFPTTTLFRYNRSPDPSQPDLR